MCNQQNISSTLIVINQNKWSLGPALANVFLCHYEKL